MQAQEPQYQECCQLFKVTPPKTQWDMDNVQLCDTTVTSLPTGPTAFQALGKSHPGLKHLTRLMGFEPTTYQHQPLHHSGWQRFTRLVKHRGTHPFPCVAPEAVHDRELFEEVDCWQHRRYDHETVG